MSNLPIAIVACNSGKKFASRIITSINDIIKDDGLNYQIEMVKSKEIIFANGEIKTEIEESVRGKDVYIVQLIDDPHSNMSVNDNIFSLLTAINAAYNSDASRITAIIPQFPYSRQERKKGREAITARIFCDILESAGVDKVITQDIHASAIEGFFTKAKLENLYAGRIILDYIRNNINIDNLMVVAPDVGSAPRGRFFAHNLNVGLAIVDKVRNYTKTSTIESMSLVGEVKGKNVLVFDDMIATGGTLLNALKLLKDKGANEIYVAASLPFFNGNAIEKFDTAFKNGDFKAVIGTDAIFWGDDFVKKHLWYIEVSVAHHFSEVIYSVNQRRSVSSFFL